MKTTITNIVPCNGCTLCCKGDAVRLLPGDGFYWTEPHPTMEGEFMLAHKDNGDCIYLGDIGCTIHDKRPLMCREMDCRLIASKFTERQARRIPGMKMSVWLKGKEVSKKKIPCTHPTKSEP